MFALFVAFGWKDLERATFSTALRTVHCPDALVAAACSATIFGVSAALEKAQAGKRPPTDLTADGGRACSSTPAATSLGVAGPPRIVLALLASHQLFWPFT